MRNAAFSKAICGACLLAYALLAAPARGEPHPPQPAPARPDVAAVEARLLAKAAENIERHRKGDATVRVRTRGGGSVRGVRVEVEQVGHDFLFGCILFDLVRDRDVYEPELFKERFRGLFNFAVLPFYWKSYEPQPGETLRPKISEVVEWCKANGIITKGHPLAWTHPAGVPDWVRNLPPDESEKRLLGRIGREVGGFRGRIDIWDVVNEPVNTRTWDNREARDYIQAPVERIANYVDKAFRAAHEANPDAHLILNEFNTIARPEARDRFVRLVEELKRRGTPVSGLGIQAHEPRQHWYPPEEVRATFDRLARFGYPLHVTEFIPQSGGKPITGGWREGRWTEEAQADFAEQMFRLAFGHPAVVSINWWGLSDRRIWQPGGGLIDEQYRPKPVYRRLERLIHDEWKTAAEGTTNEDGVFAFRGFYGRYTITVTAADGKRQTFQVALTKGEKNEWTFDLEGL